MLSSATALQPIAGSTDNIDLSPTSESEFSTVSPEWQLMDGWFLDTPKRNIEESLSANKILLLKQYAPHLLKLFKDPSLILSIIDFDKRAITFGLKDFLPYASRETSEETSTQQTIPSPEQQELLGQLEAWRRTPEEDRWPEGIWPCPNAFDEAEAFIRTLPLETIPAPRVYVAHDGEINFLWKTADLHVDLGFYGTSTYSYYARGKDGIDHLCEEAPSAAGLTEELKTLLTV